MKGKIISLLLIFIFSASNFILAEGIPVEIIKPVIKTLDEIKLINGKTEPYKTVKISSKTGGIIDELLVEEGKYCKEGEVLLRFEREEILIQLQQAEAGLEIARANNDKLLNGASKEELERARASYEQALASYNGALSSLEILETIYLDRTVQKQQMINAETQLNVARAQVAVAEEHIKQSKIGLEQVLITLEQAQNEYERIKYLYEEEVVTKKEFEIVETQLNNAEMTVENTRSSVESTKIALEQAEDNYKGAKENYDIARENYEKPTQLEQQIDAARTQLEIARANVTITKANLDMIEKGASDEDLIISSSSVRQAEASLERVKLGLEDTIIKSPINGYIARLNVEEDEMVGPGTPMFTVVNLDYLYIKIYVHADVLNKISIGDIVRAKSLTNNDNKYIEGRIKSISPVVDPQKQAYELKIIYDNNKGLRAGMCVDVYLVLDTLKNVPVIPLSAVMDLDTSPYLFIYKEGMVEKRRVETGILSGKEIGIVEGLGENETIVVKGQNTIKDGDQVEVSNL
jgi:HlyD family secretion protein